MTALALLEDSLSPGNYFLDLIGVLFTQIFYPKLLCTLLRTSYDSVIAFLTSPFEAVIQKSLRLQ